MARTVSNNFRLETTTFTAGGSMDESGKCQIVKRFLYNIVDNSESMRQRSILDLETLAFRFVQTLSVCAPDALKIYFKTETSYATFSTGYWWGLHAARMVKP